MKDNTKWTKLPPATVNLINSLPFETHSYKFIELIGAGSYAAVFKCFHVKFEKCFAAKVVELHNEDDDSIDVSQSELFALKRLDHQNIIKLYDSFNDKNHLFIILQYCERGTLNNLIKPSHGIEPSLLIPYMKQLLSALAFCHQIKIAHRDIKPENVFLDSYFRPLLADFGFAVLFSDQKIRKFCGSLRYRSPEIFQQQPHYPFKADIWALGVSFFEMASGTSPWPINQPESLQKTILSGKYKIPERVPRQIADVIRKMLVVDPDQRASAESLLDLPIFTKDTSSFIYPNIKTTLSAAPNESKKPKDKKIICKLANKSLLEPRIIIPAKMACTLCVCKSQSLKTFLQGSPKTFS
ncbi:hypothetical protein M9Y10_038599 [Tritrichomonas musculus]|uniref:Protein kinase domain-containing protein n=1 Tax=Tritrichomonas musculus TaxID=1915356 RepID=A0ABR2K8V2_9EUKA